jgi:5S rRNA maturation endonuclease (ribonuclease M5)
MRSGTRERIAEKIHNIQDILLTDPDRRLSMLCEQMIDELSEPEASLFDEDDHRESGLLSDD